MKTTTTRVVQDGDRPRLFRRKLTLQVLEGADAGASLTTSKERITVGSAPQNDLVLKDPAVSRYHLRVEVTPLGYQLTDLESTNGSFLQGLRLGQVLIQGAQDLELGESRLRLAPIGEEEEIPILDSDRFGDVLGKSMSMRELFGQLASVVKKDVTVLLEGETGTGKELVAQEIHRHSPRREGPFIIVDCGAIPSTLIESELFGHLRGAFTSATSDRPGAFEEADGGTILLDEIGELDLTHQPKLLRVLERRQVKRLGESRHRQVNVRVLAATNRDLQRGVNQGTFRADLFYRLAVIHLRIAPLRERPEDVELLIKHLLPDVARRFGLNEPPSLAPETIQQMVSYPWPGNVRELRNFLERLATISRGSVSFDPVQELTIVPVRDRRSLDDLAHLPFKEAKAQWLAHFDVGYLTRLLGRCDNNVAEAARQSGIDRVHLFRLIKKYGIKR
jgi:two-component system response regulator GlrR